LPYELLSERLRFYGDTLMIYREFDEALLKAVDFSFISLGKSCQLALYFHLKTTFGIEKADIPSKVEHLDNALRLIFRGGTVFLERLILEKLCEELGVKYEEKSHSDFAEAISKIKSRVIEEESFLTVSDLRDQAAVVQVKSGGEKFGSES
jgi:hypothetical protein